MVRSAAAVVDRWRFVPPDTKPRRPYRRGGGRPGCTCTLLSSSPIGDHGYDWTTPITVGHGYSRMSLETTNVSVVTAVASRRPKVPMTVDPFSNLFSVGTSPPKSGMHRNYKLMYDRHGMLIQKCSMQEKQTQSICSPCQTQNKNRIVFSYTHFRMSVNRFLKGVLYGQF